MTALPARPDQDGESDTAAPPPVDDGQQGGDAACWANRVCPECGRLADAAPPTRCPACGEPIAGE
jgi:rubrerythrin